MKKTQNLKKCQKWSKIWKNLQKNHKSKSLVLSRKRCYPLSFSISGGRNLTRALQSSPFQNPGGRVPWAWRSPRQTKILVSNFGWNQDCFALCALIFYTTEQLNHISKEPCKITTWTEKLKWLQFTLFFKCFHLDSFK